MKTASHWLVSSSLPDQLHFLSTTLNRAVFISQHLHHLFAPHPITPDGQPSMLFWDHQCHPNRLTCGTPQACYLFFFFWQYLSPWTTPFLNSLPLSFSSSTHSGFTFSLFDSSFSTPCGLYSLENRASQLQLLLILCVSSKLKDPLGQEPRCIQPYTPLPNV